MASPPAGKVRGERTGHRGGQLHGRTAGDRRHVSKHAARRWSTACWPRRTRPGDSAMTISRSASTRSRPSIPPTISGADRRAGSRAVRGGSRLRRPGLLPRRVPARGGRRSAGRPAPDGRVHLAGDPRDVDARRRHPGVGAPPYRRERLADQPRSLLRAAGRSDRDHHRTIHTYRGTYHITHYH